MKKIYSFALAVLCGAGMMAQTRNADLISAQDAGYVGANTNGLSLEFERRGTIHAKSSERGTAATFWEYDFSNGFSGNEANQEWSFAGPQGNLWFITYPMGEPNGYDPDASIASVNPAYGDFLANWFTNSTTINSNTASNGFAMIDMDRWNSTRTGPTTNPAGVTTSNFVESELISPVIDLSAAEGIGAEIEFETSFRRCCSNTNNIMEVVVSFDGGNTWLEDDAIDVWRLYGGNFNTAYATTGYACLSGLILQQNDLTQFRFKFRVGGANSHYMWMIDDVAIVVPIENDISIGSDTYFNDYEEASFNPTEDDVEYWTGLWNGFEVEYTPSYLVKPLRFGGVVRNLCSQNTQTNARIRATITAPDGSTQEVFTAPIDVDPTSTALVYSEPTYLNAWETSGAEGEYVVTYEVLSDQEDDRPENNIGAVRRFFITGDSEEQGARVQNGLGFSGTYTADWLTQNLLINTPFIFDEPLISGSVITHVEVAFLDWRDFSTIVEEAVFFNVRTGVVFLDNPTTENPNPIPVSQAVFGTNNFQYTDADLEYIIPADVLNDPDETPGQLVYASFELPSPVLIEPGVVYMPEINILAGAQGAPVAFIAQHSPRQEEGGYLIRPRSAAPGVTANRWYFLGGAGIPSLRFRTAAALSVDKVSYESGIKLTQNYPNPFVDETRFQLQLDRIARTRLEVRDLSGKLVHTEDFGTLNPGVVYTYRLGRNGLAAGMYTYSIFAGEDMVTRKMVVE